MESLTKQKSTVASKRAADIATKSRRPVVVTTAHRGIFFGYVKEDSSLPKEITLERARLCVYYPASTKGFLGLCASGPQPGSRIGESVPEITLFDVTSVGACSAEAVEAWEKGLWS